MRNFLLIALFAGVTISSAVAGVLYKTVENYFACSSKSDMIKISNYSRVSDEQAARSLVENGRCIILKGGVDVQVMSSYTEEGMEYVEIRPFGTEITVWTFRKGIE